MSKIIKTRDRDGYDLNFERQTFMSVEQFTKYGRSMEFTSDMDYGEEKVNE